MPEFGQGIPGQPGTNISGPVVGALVPFVLGPFTPGGTVAAGAGEIGFYCPCDMRIESVSWAAMTYPGATSTIAIYNHTDINGGNGGTAVLAATAVTAGGRAEGAAFVQAARNFTKGQYCVIDPVFANSAPANMTITIMMTITGHAVADVTAR